MKGHQIYRQTVQFRHFLAFHAFGTTKLIVYMCVGGNNFVFETGKLVLLDKFQAYFLPRAVGVKSQIKARKTY